MSDQRLARVTAVLSAAEIPPSKSGRTRGAGLTSSERELYAWILRRFAQVGRPSRADTAVAAARFGLDADAALDTLAREDLVHAGADGEIAVAYPFSGRPTAHRVRLANGNRVFAMCAIDALGIAPMLDQPIRISSRDARTGEAVEIHLEPAGSGAWQPREAVVVAGVSGRGDSCRSCCPVLNFFASPASAEEWLRAHPDVHGTVVSIPDALAAGRAVFGDILMDA